MGNNSLEIRIFADFAKSLLCLLQQLYASGVILSTIKNAYEHKTKNLNSKMELNGIVFLVLKGWQSEN